MVVHPIGKTQLLRMVHPIHSERFRGISIVVKNASHDYTSMLQKLKIVTMSLIRAAQTYLSLR